MPKLRKAATEPYKQLMVELPLSEYQILEEYCQQPQETKGQVVLTWIRRLKSHLSSNES
ncbi:MAG: CopG family transcriptional regulator [Microcystis aeruginosa Ma_MB_S_20031200_S102]|uniref:CopG family transcriptional regulator n=1 Tax=Microcystis aeruginosa Ma_MB_S_20031200_S102 TaxID=2486254 RepID=A0A552EP42_MICAE|nr:MAG: CopG family transcriptional regulator [Microcystis aeruginosa Ma_MB_S_20031200_S102D]TRU36246.1 MAG: CopG family transcriptional regulator [Microcystis aeruginosa Ma_MB_S_20031200_S102]